MHVINHGNSTLVFAPSAFAEEMLLWFKERVEWREPTFQIPRIFAVGLTAEAACDVVGTTTPNGIAISEIKSLAEMGTVINWLLDI